MGSARCPGLWMVEAARVGQLSPPQAAQLREHLQSGCHACRHEKRYLEWLGETLLAQDAPSDEVALRRLRRATLQRAHDKVYRSPVISWRVARLPLGAVLALVMALAAWHGFGRTPEIMVTPLTAAAPVQRRSESDREVVVLGDGVYELSVHRRLFDRHVVVQLPEGEIQDIGTVFGISVRDGRTARVVVTQGAVVLHLRGLPEMRLEAGTIWEPPAAPEVKPLPNAPTREPPQSAPSMPSIASTQQSVANTTPDAGLRQDPPPSHGHQRHAQAHGKTPSTLRVYDAGVVDIDGAGEDATYLRVLDLLRQNRGADAKRLAELYLERFSHGFRRPEIERIARPDEILH